MEADNTHHVFEEACYHDTIGNYTRAVELFWIAKDAGRTSAAVRLAVLYADGRGVACSPSVAAQLLMWAIDRGDGSAAFNYASMLHGGAHGLPQDRERAQHFFRLAKSLGFDTVSVNQWLESPDSQ